MEKDQIVLLEDRGLISITGEDTKNFLQNIITNDIEIRTVKVLSADINIVISKPSIAVVVTRLCRLNSLFKNIFNSVFYIFR